MLTKIKTVTVFKDIELDDLKEALEDSRNAARSFLVDWGTSAEREAYDNFMSIIENATEIRIIKEETKGE